VRAKLAHRRACPISGFKVHSLPWSLIVSMVCFIFIPFYFVEYSIYTTTCIVATHLFAEVSETTVNLISYLKNPCNANDLRRFRAVRKESFV